MADMCLANIVILHCEMLKLRREERRRSTKALLKFSRNVRARKKRVCQFLLLILRCLLARTERRFWVEPGRAGCSFWENTVFNWHESDVERLWVQNFRLSKSTFEIVCELLNARLTKENTVFRKSIPIKKRVAICMWHLATGEDFRSLAWRFDVGKSTACTIVNEVCQSIVDILLPLYITWPTGEKLLEVVEGFLSKWNFPQCAGAIDGTHIPIVAPPHHSSHYYNRKSFYSIVMQATVDHAYRFTDIYINWPGRVHDARILKNSSLYTKGQQGERFSNETKEISGVNVPIMLVGDPAYPLLPWLMKRFPADGQLSEREICFNYHLSRARMVVEAAFGRLKGRFRCLLRRIDTSLQYLPTKIAACCVLHNLCELKNDLFHNEWMHEIPVEEEIDGDDGAESENDGPDSVHTVRDALADFFLL